jgi:hypothetical protein
MCSRRRACGISWIFCFHRHQSWLARHQDGSLLALAERGFDVFVTIDRKFEHHNDLRTIAMGFVIVCVASNTIGAHLSSFNRLRRAVETVPKGEVIHLDARTA